MTVFWHFSKQNTLPLIGKNDSLVDDATNLSLHLRQCLLEIFLET